LARQLRDGAATGLTRQPMPLSPTRLYDDTGSDLFNQITRLPEHYTTSRERHILTMFAGNIATAVAADILVELGSGICEKTRFLLPSLTRQGLCEPTYPSTPPRPQ
jgi:L-histidine N-alpha-methyltransferase